jgi:hypothetical protein
MGARPSSFFNFNPKPYLRPSPQIYIPPPPRNLDRECKGRVDDAKTTRANNYESQITTEKENAYTQVEVNTEKSKDDLSKAIDQLRALFNLRYEDLLGTTIQAVSTSVSSGQEASNDDYKYKQIINENDFIQKQIEIINRKLSTTRQETQTNKRQIELFYKYNYYLTLFYYILVLLLAIIFIINNKFSILTRIFLFLLVLFLPHLLDIIEQVILFIYKTIKYMLLFSRRESNMKSV